MHQFSSETMGDISHAIILALFSYLLCITFFFRILRPPNSMQMNSQTNGSENNAASNHISANVANGSKAGENSDEESDAQVSI